MKNLITLVLLVASLAIPVKAQQVDSKVLSDLNTALTDLATTVKQVNDFDSSVISKLDERKTALDVTTNTLSTDLSAYTSKRTDFSTRVDAHGEAIKQHNDAKPDTHCKSCVEAYNAEADRLDAETESLVKEGTELDTTQTGLKKRYNQLAQDADTLDADYKKADADREVLTQKGKDEVVKMTPLVSAYAACMNKYPKDDDNALQHDCGTLVVSSVRKTITNVIDAEKALETSKTPKTSKS